MDPPTDDQTHEPGANRAFAEHSRQWEDSAYVYPVISRRSKGLSIGVNLNPDTICNFDCVYCQVEKIEPPRPVPVEVDRLRDELDAMAGAVADGSLWSHPRFADVDPSLRRLNDIAFSGDGEPTAAACFAEAVDVAAEVRRRHRLTEARLVVLTNATLLDRPGVEAALKVLDENGGEVWAKLDAGTQGYYKAVDRCAIPLPRILENILACGRRRPIVIQSMFLKLHGDPIPADEFDAYADRVAELIGDGCRIKLIQLYTVARRPLEAYVEPLSDDQLAELAARLRRRIDRVADGVTTAIEVFGKSG